MEGHDPAAVAMAHRSVARSVQRMTTLGVPRWAAMALYKAIASPDFVVRAEAFAAAVEAMVARSEQVQVWTGREASGERGVGLGAAGSAAPLPAPSTANGLARRPKRGREGGVQLVNPHALVRQATGAGVAEQQWPALQAPGDMSASVLTAPGGGASSAPLPRAAAEKQELVLTAALRRAKAPHATATPPSSGVSVYPAGSPSFSTPPPASGTSVLGGGYSAAGAALRGEPYWLSSGVPPHSTFKRPRPYSEDEDEVEDEDYDF